MIDHTNRTAVITGAASGIGYGIAKKCIRNDMNVVLADIDKASLEHTKDEMSLSAHRCMALAVDVTKEKDVQNLSAKAIGEFGKVDFLFINAGVNIRAFMSEYDLLDWKWIIDVNLWGTIHCENLLGDNEKGRERITYSYDLLRRRISTFSDCRSL